MQPRPKPKSTNQMIMDGLIGGLFSAAIAAFICSSRSSTVEDEFADVDDQSREESADDDATKVDPAHADTS